MRGENKGGEVSDADVIIYETEREEVFGEDNITCPYCGYVDKDSWEVMASDAFMEEEIDCGSCGKTFKCDRDITVTYNTRAMKQVTNDTQTK